MAVAAESLSIGSGQEALGRRRAVRIISAFRIFPSFTGAHVRTGGIARALARAGYDVCIHSLAGRQDDYRSGNALHPGYEVAQIEPNLREETHLGLGIGLTQTVARRLDYPRCWLHALLRRGVIPGRLRLGLRHADIILSDTPWCPKIPGPWSSKPWFLISHNLEHRLLEQAEHHRRFAAWMRAVEAEAPGSFTDIFACAEEDRDFFRRQDAAGRLQLPIIRCGVDPGAYKVPNGTREQIRRGLGLRQEEWVLLFSGSRFGPNVEALAELRNFCRENSAQLLSRGIRLLVVGMVAAEPFTEGALIATGPVTRVAPYFAAADAGLNAITRGSGANVKLFEYLAAGLPVISTAFGVRGTTLEPHADYLPYEPGGLGAVLEHFVRARTRGEWRMHAAAVWARHRGSCDIQCLVEQAVAQVPQFAPAEQAAPADQAGMVRPGLVATGDRSSNRRSRSWAGISSSR